MKILIQSLHDVINRDNFVDWAWPLWDEMRNSSYSYCLVNLVTFVEHFGISKEVFQQVVDSARIDHRTHINLDVLYSGDWTLINQYNSIENDELHWQIGDERRTTYFATKFRELQRIVYDNASGYYSIYFHDVWTYLYFVPNAGQAWHFLWMQALVDAGEYDRVNIIEFLSTTNLDKEIFGYRVNDWNLNIFTHYNVDILFSGDEQLIRQYYSIENEAAHTAQVQAAFDQYVATYGPPDTSWMVPRERPIELPTDYPTDTPTEIPTDIPTELPTEPHILSIQPSQVSVARGSVIELVVTTQNMPDGAWVDINVAWRTGLSIVDGPRFTVEDNRAIITIAVCESAPAGRDGFSVVARAADRWGSAFIIDNYSIVIQVV